MFGKTKLINDLKWEVNTLRYKLDETRDEYQASLNLLRKQIAAIAAGKSVDPGAIIEGRPYAEINSLDLQQLIENNKRPFVLDVRTDGEWNQGHIEGAMHIEVNSLPDRLSMLANKDERIYAICASGGRSASAAELLSESGFSDVVNVIGGMQAYQGEIVTPQLEPLSIKGIPGDESLLSKVALFLDQNVRPNLRNDGGDLEFHGIEEDIALLRLSGACGGCGSRSTTVNLGIKEVLTKEFTEIKGVKEI